MFDCRCFSFSAVFLLLTFLAPSISRAEIGPAAKAKTNVVLEEVSGIVLTLDNRGISGARVVITLPNGEMRFTQTNPFGYFRFRDVPTGQNAFAVSRKRFQFTPQTLTISGATNLLFTPLPTQTGFALDSSFGNGGKVVTDFGGVDRALRVMSQSDGKLLVVGLTSLPWLGMAMARYNSDGSLDPNFGSGGKVISTNLVLSADLTGKPLALYADNKIVVAGKSSDNDFMLERYSTNGTLDQNFGDNGAVRLDFGMSSFDQARAVAIQPDGKIVAVGSTNFGTAEVGIGVARFNSNGSLDTSFGSGGKAIVDTPNIDDAGAVLIQPNGKIVICGTLQNTKQMVVRLNENGTLDSSFGENGIAISPRIGLKGKGVSMQRDGKILGVGESLVRYGSSGILDSAFNGPAEGTGVPNVELETVTVRNDGIILVAGRSFQNNLGDFGVALIHPFTAQVLSRIETDVIVQNFDNPKDIVVQADGKIIVAGFTQSASSSDFAIVRYVNPS